VDGDSNRVLCARQNAASLERMRTDARALASTILLGWSFVVALSGCASDPSGLVTVDVRTGLVAGPEFRTVTVEVFQRGEAPADNRLVYEEVRASAGDDYARGQRVSELLLPAGVHLITVRLLRPDRRLLVALSQLVSVGDGASRVAVFRLTRDCVGDVVCPSPGGSAALTECLAGHCVDPRCEPPDPTYCPDIVFCNADADCGAIAGCATNRCGDGICIEEPIAGACAATEYCHPAMGCTDLSTPVEPGEVECGEFCEGPCTAGIWVCDGDAPRCSVVSFKDEGVACGTGGTCDAEGMCSAP